MNQLELWVPASVLRFFCLVGSEDALQEAGQRRAARGARHRDLQHLVLCEATAVSFDPVLVPRMAIGHEELRVVERGAAIAHALVGQRSRKATMASFRRKPDWGGRAARWACRRLRDRRHVAAAAIELHDLAQRQGVAVVEVRSGQRDVAQRGDLERALDAETLGHGRAIEGGRQRVREEALPCESGPKASLAPAPKSSSVGRRPMLLKPLSMTLPSRLRTGPLTAELIRRTDASVSWRSRGNWCSAGCSGRGSGR